METKEKAAYAIAEVAQEEWNRIQGLSKACKANTHILEVRKSEDTICGVIGMLFTVDKIEQKCMPNTTHGSFRDCLKTGKR